MFTLNTKIAYIKHAKYLKKTSDKNMHHIVATVHSQFINT